MAMADTIRQCDALPSIKPTINFLDLDKFKKESTYGPRQPASAALNMPAPPLISPSNLYSGPPPPYSYPSSTASSVIGHGGYLSPVESRKTDEDKEQPTTHRHSLPSIHEALGNEPPLSITSLLSKPNPLQIPESNHNQSPTTAIPRSYPETPRGPPNLITQPSPTAYHFRESLDKRGQYSPRASNDSVPPRFPAASSHDTHYPSIQPSRTGASPAHPLRANSQVIPTQQLSPVYDRGLRGPPETNPSYPYNSYAQPYSYPSSSAGAPSYQPLQPPSWRTGGEVDRAEEVRRSAGKPSPRPQYGESVKRHLEAFDLETSLNEIALGSRQASDFALKYGMRAHQDARAGMTADTLPSSEECTQMIQRQNEVLECMRRIKSVIDTQQEALKQRLSQEQRYNAANEYDEESIGPYDKLEGGGGFAGGDAKKRRGRAAPPGRCHSCNRAETPEWRRGPDGARTLCNACGLHYAKLTRKFGKPPPNGSNIRPKEIRTGSP